jgi:hypothetical protein
MRAHPPPQIVQRHGEHDVCYRVAVEQPASSTNLGQPNHIDQEGVHRRRSYTEHILGPSGDHRCGRRPCTHVLSCTHVDAGAQGPQRARSGPGLGPGPGRSASGADPQSHPHTTAYKAIYARAAGRLSPPRRTMPEDKNTLSIALTEPVVFLRGADHAGRRPDAPDAPDAPGGAPLRGLLTLTLARPTRISSIEVELTCRANMTWPEGEL